MKKRGIAIAFNTLIPWMIGILVLMLSLALYMILKGKAEGAIEFLKNLLRFSG